MHTIHIGVFAIFLASCTSNLHTVTTTQNIPAPPVSAPPDLQMQPFNFDVPRDMKQTTIKDISDCITNKNHDDYFWKTCGEHPPLTDSNIFIGFDQKNWIIFKQDWAKLEAREQMWQERLKEINDRAAQSK